MPSNEDFISRVCNAFKEAVESASEVTLEGREREFRRILTQYLFDELLGWKRHSKLGEIYDIRFLDDEGFPVILTETKWRVKLTSEIKEKLRRRVEELGSVKYGVFASEREFIVYAYEDYELREITKVNVAELVGVAKKQFELSEVGKRRVLKLETLRRERLVWIEDPDYFEKTHNEISVVKKEGVELLTENLKDVVRDTTRVLMNFFESYRKRKDHYSGSFLENTFNDWLKLSMKDEDFKKGNETERRKIIEVFCRETAYVLLGKVLFTRICEDKGITKLRISGKGLAESLRYYKRRRKKPYLIIFSESREEIRKYYTHLYRLGYFDWWWISPEKRGLLGHEDERIQDTLEEDLNYSIKKMFRRFNRFDFTQVNRDILGDVYQGYLPPNERKQLGEFYTPKEVIDYILDVVGYKPENEINGKKILDPSCGSGSFLVEATQRLIERYRRIGFHLRDPDDAKQIIDGCVSSIYGLDIHPFACFIAEMNLLFQLVDLYDTVRQKDKYYELPRLNVYRTDSLAPSGESIVLSDFLDNSRRKMLIEDTKGAIGIKRNEFDYIVGNPPYVRIQRIAEVVAGYKQNYESAYKNFDLYVLFVERGIRWLKKNGRFGFICSNQFMVREYGKKLRSYILKNCSIIHIIDFGDSGVFREVTNYPCILILERDSRVQAFKCVKVLKPKTGLLDEILSNFNLDRYQDADYDLFTVDQESLTEDFWRLFSIREKEILTKINEQCTHLLGERSKILLGSQTGRDKLLIVQKVRDVDNKLVEIAPSGHPDETFVIESDLLKPVLKGRNVRRWEIRWDGTYIIYPHRKETDKVVSISEEEIEREFPHTYNYFRKYKKDLETRVWYRKNPVQLHGTWYALMYYAASKDFEQPKILTPALTSKNNFCLDEKGLYHFVMGTAGVYGILPTEIDVLYVLGLLNSKVSEYYLKHISPIKAGGYFQYSIKYLEKLPIKLPHTKEENGISEQISNSVNEILKLKQSELEAEERVRNFPHDYFKSEWKFSRLTNVIKAQNLSKSSYTISEKLLKTHWLKDLDGKEIFRINLAPNEYVDLSSEDIASYVFEVLKTLNRITKRELLELEIPQQPHSKNLIDQYRRDKEQIVENEKTVKELEKQIDDLVYKLYDITYKERRIIKEYLAKF